MKSSDNINLVNCCNSLGFIALTMKGACPHLMNITSSQAARKTGKYFSYYYATQKSPTSQKVYEKRTNPLE